MKKSYREINLEYDMPTSQEAMSYLKRQIELGRQSKVGCLLVVHGYGSSGTGGKIRKDCRSWLMAQVRNKKIKTVVFGEDFNVLQPEVIRLKTAYPQLNHLLTICNHGVTVVEL